MSVYGDPSDELRAALAGFNPRYLDALAGYVRHWLLRRAQVSTEMNAGAATVLATVPGPARRWRPTRRVLRASTYPA
jgi:hypothetical protein